MQFDSLEKMVKESFGTDSQKIKSDLERGKQYLKIQFQHRCSLDSTSITHNISHALSDSSEDMLQSHFDECNQVCVDCLSLFATLQEMQNYAESIGDPDNNLRCKQCSERYLGLHEAFG